jgi:hypothetical protein
LSRQPDIEHDATGTGRKFRLKESGGGAEHLDPQVNRTKQIADAFTDGLVVIDHQDNGFLAARIMLCRVRLLCHDANPALVRSVASLAALQPCGAAPNAVKQYAEPRLCRLDHGQDTAEDRALFGRA